MEGRKPESCPGRLNAKQTQSAGNAGMDGGRAARQRFPSGAGEDDGKPLESAVAFEFIDGASGRYEAHDADETEAFTSLVNASRPLQPRRSAISHHSISPKFNVFQNIGPTSRAESPARYGTKSGTLAKASDEESPC